MTQIALLDADIIVFQSAVVSQSDIDWGDGQEGLTVDPDSALAKAREKITEWTKAARCGKPILCFSSKEKLNFRKTVLPTYKANRTAPKPEAYGFVMEALEAEYKTFRIEGLEADDIIGIASTQDRFKNAVVVSTDKDMKTLPAMLFNPNEGGRPRRMRPQLADYYWMVQTLTGDSVDGYKGCPGVGPVTAEKILNEAGLFLPAMWAAVVATFESKGLTEQDAIVQARVARILRSTDYNRDTKQICLWHPAKPKWISLADLPLASSVSTPQPPKAERPKQQKSSAAASGSKRSSSRERSKA